jgi:hypothetical protein
MNKRIEIINGDITGQNTDAGCSRNLTEMTDQVEGESGLNSH